MSKKWAVMFEYVTMGEFNVEADSYEEALEAAYDKLYTLDVDCYTICQEPVEVVALELIDDD